MLKPYNLTFTRLTTTFFLWNLIFLLNAKEIPIKKEMKKIAKPTSPTFSVSPEVAIGKAYATYDFGKVKEGQFPSHNFEFKNTSKKNITILDSRIPCGCAKIAIKNNVLEPGDTSKFPVKLDSRKYQGKISKSFYLLTNSKVRPIIKYTVKATIIATPTPICYAPSLINIPPLNLSEETAGSLNIENRGLKELVIETRRPPQGIKIKTKFPLIVLPGKTNKLDFLITAPAKRGEFSKNIVLLTNDKRRKVVLVVIKSAVK